MRRDGEPIQVLVVDDSPTARELLVSILGAAPGVRVVGEAASGEAAVEMAKALRPDVITMDILMPGMDGYEATERIMIEAPTPIVIVSGHVDVSEVSVSMRALRAGALAVSQRPSGPLSAAFQATADELVRLVKAMAEVKVVRRWPVRPAEGAAAPARRPISQRVAMSRLRAAAIAASTGGPAALYRLLADLSPSFRPPILVVQHMSRGFIEGLADWLSGASARRVKVAEDGEPLAPGTVYIAPDDLHLGLSASASIRLSEAAPVGAFRPSATFLFTSVASVLGSSAVGVVLTGMGHDGVEGLRLLQRAGGRVIAQDEETSVVFGMPGAAIAAGVVDIIAPLGEIAANLCAMTTIGSASGAARGKG
jgi:two-component system chemotaxis response regulator CheB